MLSAFASPPPRLDLVGLTAAIVASYVAKHATQAALFQRLYGGGDATKAVVSFSPPAEVLGHIASVRVARWLSVAFGYGIALARGDIRAYHITTLAAGGGRPVVHRVGISSARVVLCDCRDAEEVLLKSQACKFVKPHRYRLLRPMLGLGLVTLEDEALHTVHRRAMNGAFSPATLREIAETTMTTEFQRMLEVLRDEHAADPLLEAGHSRSTASAQRCAAMDPQALLDETTLNIISEAAFRTKDLTVLHSLQSRVSISLLAFVLPYSVWEWLPTRNLRNTRLVRKLLSGIIAKVLAACRDESAEGDRTAQQEQQQLLRLEERGCRTLIDYLASSRQLSPACVLDNAITFVFAGHDTTSTAINSCIMLLARHPVVQERLAEELASAMPLDGVSVPPIQELQQLPYLDAVVHETLRLCPPVYQIGRRATEDCFLPRAGIVVPAGCEISISILAIHLNPNIWGADAAEFRPERWHSPPPSESIMNIPENRHRVLRDVLPPCAFAPFIAGKHTCIGKDFAMFELYKSIALVFRRLQAVWPDGQGIGHLRAGAVVRPEVPWVIEWKRREK